MKYAIMSDAHSNPKALEIALADAVEQGCERFIFLGDITGYGYDVKKTLNLVRRRFQVVLKGNHDSACLGLEPKWVTDYCRNYDIDLAQGRTLSERAVKWLKARPFTHSEAGAAFTHGDFLDPSDWGYILRVREASESLQVRKEDLLFCGHTHAATLWETNADGGVAERRLFKYPAFEPELKTVKLVKGRRYIVNVGSVGYPRNDFCSTYAIWDPTACEVSFRRLPFDFKGYTMEMIKHTVDLPNWLVELWSVARRGAG